MKDTSTFFLFKNDAKLLHLTQLSVLMYGIVPSFRPIVSIKIYLLDSKVNVMSLEKSI